MLIPLLFLQDLDPKALPTCECLKDTVARVLPYWNDAIVPMMKVSLLNSFLTDNRIDLNDFFFFIKLFYLFRIYIMDYQVHFKIY